MDATVTKRCIFRGCGAVLRDANTLSGLLVAGFRQLKFQPVVHVVMGEEPV